MEMRLRVESGKNAGQEVRIPGKSFVIGRGDDCQLRAGSDMISRRHCELIVQDSYAAVRDLNSRNGTFVNGEQIKGEVKVNSGDKLKIGPLEFEIVLATGLTGKKHPPVHGVKEAAARSAGSAANSEADIAKWLMEDGAQPGPPNPVAPTAAFAAQTSQDTQSLRMSDTEAIKLGNTLDGSGPAKTIVDQPATAEEDAEKRSLFGGAPKPKKVFGKLPQQQVDAPKSSRDAAAKMIEQMRKRR